jgi:hypothetical protein
LELPADAEPACAAAPPVALPASFTLAPLLPPLAVELPPAPGALPWVSPQATSKPRSSATGSPPKIERATLPIAS